MTVSATLKLLETELTSEVESRLLRVETLLTLFAPVVESPDEPRYTSRVGFLLGSTGRFGSGTPSMCSGYKSAYSTRPPVST